MIEPLKKFIDQFFAQEGTLLNSGIYVVIIIFVGAIVWWIFNLIIRRFRKVYGKRDFFLKNPKIFPIIKKAGHFSIVIFLCAVLINLIDIPFLANIAYAMIIILLASFINSIFKDILPYLKEGITSKTETKLDDVIFELANKFATVIIIATAFILVLDVLGINIMPFVAGAGVAGIAIGFAAKDTLSNIIAGVLLILDRPFEVGDRIEVWSAPVNSATWGDVIDIGLRATRIKTTDNIVIVIPNNEIMRRDIINYTTISQEIRVRIPIGIAYDADVKKAKEIIRDVCLELEWVMKDPPPKIVVKSFGESAVNLEARVWISRPRRRIDTISHITDRVKDKFCEEGIEIPFPKRDIYIKRAEE